MSQNPQEKKENIQLLSNNDDYSIEPYVLYDYSIRSHQTGDSYFRRLKTFFNYSKVDRIDFREKCNSFARMGRQYPNQTLKLILEFLQFQKQRVENKEITSGTLKNYQKTLKSFCETTDIVVPWKKIIRGLPRGKRYADDRAPTLEEIQKIVDYPDRRIKPIVCVMASSGIRVGAWDYLKWGHVIPSVSKDDNAVVVAAKLRVYANEDDEYYTFISPEAYYLLKNWMGFSTKKW
jgi:integrase